MSDSFASRARFKSMETSTADDWKLITSQFLPFAQGLPDRVLAHLRLRRVFLQPRQSIYKDMAP